MKTGGHLEISGNLLGGSDEDKEIMIDVTSKNITIGGPESKVITGGHLEVSGNIISNIDENKDIFFDVVSKRSGSRRISIGYFFSSKFSTYYSHTFFITLQPISFI